MAAGAADKRSALERMRRSSRVRTIAAVFALGSLLGAAIVQAMAVLSQPPNTADADYRQPAIASIEPGENAFLAAGNTTFRTTFDERIVAPPGATFTGPEDLAIATISFDGLVWRGAVEIPTAKDGPYVLHLAGMTDRHGNRAEQAFAYLVDSTPPTARASVTANATASPFDVAWDASDGNGSGIAAVDLWYRADGGPWTLLISSSAARGAYRFDPGSRRAVLDLAAVPTDRAGNQGRGPEPQARLLYNAIPPSASLQPLDRYWFRSPPDLAAIRATETTSADLRYHFSSDNATWQGPFSLGPDSSMKWTFPFPLGPGHYRVYARGANAHGDLEGDQLPTASEVWCGFDIASPTSVLRSLSPYWHSGPVVVEGNATDDRSGVARVELLYAFRANVSAAWSQWTFAAFRVNPPWSFTFDFPRGDGRYDFTTRALDGAGTSEALAFPGEGKLHLGFNREPPASPTLILPNYVDPSGLVNLSWNATPPADVTRFEVHRGSSLDFTIDEGPCANSATCVLEIARDDRAAWVVLPARNETYWFRVVAVDEGGLRGASGTKGASLRGPGYDTKGVYSQASALPRDVAWSESLEYRNGCVDCFDVFKVSLSRGAVLSASLAVPITGDFRIVVYNVAIQMVAVSQRSGLGVWESVLYEVTSAGTYYVVVDWSYAFGPGNVNQGWYTLSASIG